MKYVNHIEPVAPGRARGVVADVYADARREFGRLPEPVSMLSPNEDLLAAWWATLRETLIAGDAPRARKEAVAAAVAVTQRCPWCVDAHTTMLYAAGESNTAQAILGDKPLPESDPNAAYVEWARGSVAPGGPPAPFGSELAVEYIGTAMIFHFVTRLVLVLLDETFLPGGQRAQSLMRRAAGLAFARKVPASYVPGLASARLGTTPLPEDLAWTSAAPPVAKAFAALTDCLENARHLPEAGRAVVSEAVAAWDGEALPISSSWTDAHTAGLPGDLRAAARLALLTSLSPHQVTDADVRAARQLLTTDAALVTALAWSAWTAARRIGQWISWPADMSSARFVQGDRMSDANVVRSYHDSWTRRDMTTARSCLADDLDFHGPIDTFSSADDFIATLSGFAQMLTRVDLLQEFYTDDGAALLYDCVTDSPAGTIRTAEFFGLRDGKVATIRLVFDAAALRQVMNG